MSLDIPPSILSCIVPLERAEDSSFLGTGFLLECYQCVEESHLYMPILVTNKHVVEGEQIQYRYNLNTGGLGVRKVGGVFGGLGFNWVHHPDEDIDLVAAMIPFTENQQEKGFGKGYIGSVTSINEGRDLFYMGFPLGKGAEGGIPHKPILRSGHLAQKGEKTFIMEADVFPGSSGSPVFTKPRFTLDENGNLKAETLSLIGVVSSYIPYTDVAVSRQTGRPRIIFEDNSGLSNVFCIQAVDDITNTSEFEDQAGPIIEKLEETTGKTLKKV